MRQIPFDDHTRFSFARFFLDRLAHPSYGFQTDEPTLTIRGSHATLMQCIERLATGKPTLLPYRTSTSDAWMVLASSRESLDEVIRVLGHWLVPSYATFMTDGTTPQRNVFNPSQSDLHTLGAQLFPHGYYRLESDPKIFHQILETLGMWFHVDAQHPSLHHHQYPSYHELAQAFRIALAASNWTEAEARLSDMHRFRVCSAENLLFFEFHLLGQQHAWNRIWDHPAYSTVARLHLPRSIRSTLLIAFYHACVLPWEQKDQWDQAIATVKESLPRLGQLLTGRFGNTHPAVIAVFAYRARLDTQWDDLYALRALAVDGNVRCLDIFLADAPADDSPSLDHPLSARERCILALEERRFDAAHEAILAIDDAALQARFFLRLGFMSGDYATIQHALLVWWDLPADQQTTHLQTAPELQHILHVLEQHLQHEEHTPIVSWAAWHRHLLAHPTDSTLVTARSHLMQLLEDSSMTPEILSELEALFLEVMITPHLAHLALVQQTLKDIAASIVNAPSFPHDDVLSQRVYEAIVVYILDQCPPSESIGFLVLRLLDGLVRAAPNHVYTFVDPVLTWLKTPIPALEPVVLEAYDLFAEYGIQGSMLFNHYRTWLEALLHLPTKRSHQILNVWHAFALWIQPGDDLIRTLETALNDDADTDTSPLSTLPDNTKIVIFTLRESSARRAKDILVKENPTFNIQICTEKDLNPQVRAFAQQTDLALIVTTCITHALTYGIQPHLRPEQIVYVNASGTTSILRALEEYCVQQVV